MTHGSLFSGIGGFDLAAVWMGWENKFHCEWNEFGQKVLKYYWPNATSYTDITKTDFSFWRGKIFILTGGFPCQPFSNAGEGMGESDERYLFKEMLRAIREIRPEWIVAENVRGITSFKFKKIFNEIYSSLESEGYNVSQILIPASAVGADHERYRIWIVAHAKRIGQQSKREFGNERSFKKNEGRETNWPELLFQGQSLPHLYQHDDGIPKGLVNKAVSEWRKHANTGVGNAIVPQIAYEIFKTIEQYETQNQS